MTLIHLKDKLFHSVPDNKRGMATAIHEKVIEKMKEEMNAAEIEI